MQYHVTASTRRQWSRSLACPSPHRPAKNMAGVTYTLLIVAALCSQHASGKYISGWLDAEKEQNFNDWRFLTRFCLVSGEGAFTYVFQYPAKYATQDILLYYDEPGQWNSAYGSSLNCSAKRDLLNPLNNQIISLNTSNTQTSYASGCQAMARDGEVWYNCTGGRSFRSSRERWWYFAVCRCDQAQGQPAGLKLYYELHLTNSEPGDLLRYEFSADEFYILPIDISFLLAYIVIIILSIICAVHLANRQLLHTTYKMFLVAVGLYAFHILLLTIVYGKYANDGLENRNARTLARVIGSAGEMVFLLMLILMGKGYTITRGKLPTHSVVKLNIFTTLYVLAYIVLYVWEAVIFDPAIVLYLYESPAGYGLIAMKFLGWLWFLYSIFFTLKYHPKKGVFYYPFFAFFTIWFWAGPIVIIVAMRAMALWTREKTVAGVELFVALCGHVFFLILTRPNAANKNFPYHVRTTQIGILEDRSEEGEGGTEGEMQSSGYPQYPYSTRSETAGTGPDFSKLFVVSHTRSNGLSPLPPLSSTLPPLSSTLPPDNNNDSLPPSYSSTLAQDSMPRGRGGLLPPIAGSSGGQGGENVEPSAPPMTSGPPPNYDSMFSVGGRKKAP